MVLLKLSTLSHLVAASAASLSCSTTPHSPVEESSDNANCGKLVGNGENSFSSKITTTEPDFFRIQSTEITNATGDIPVQRQSHTAIVANTLGGQKMIVFGGYKGRRYYNDVFEYDLEKKHWSHIPVVMKNPNDDPPRGRMWHSGVYLEKEQKMVIFAGETDDEKDLNDMYEFDIMERNWTQIKPSLNSLWPCTRSCHSTVLRKRINEQGVEEQSMVIFAGNNDGHKMNDLFEFSFLDRKWVKHSDGSKLSKANKKRNRLDLGQSSIEEKEEEEKMPKARYNHTAVMQNKSDRMFVFGGKSGTSRLNDIWCFDFATGSWFEIESSGYKPTARSVHSCVILPGEDQCVLFGGYNGNSKMNDMYSLDMVTMKWRQLTIHDDAPHPTSNLSMALASPRDCQADTKLLIFGGYNGDFVVNNMYEMKIVRIRDDDSHVVEQTPSEFTIDLSKIINGASYCSDICLMVQNRQFYCHKFIITQCPVLLQLIEHQQESEKVTIVRDVHPIIFEKLLQFLYGIEPQVDATNLVELVCAARQFQMSGLVNWCHNLIKDGKLLSTSNILKVIREAEDRNQQELCRVCIYHVRKMSNDLREKVIDSPEFRSISKNFLMEMLKTPESPLEVGHSRRSCINYSTSCVGKSTVSRAEMMSPGRLLMSHLQRLYNTSHSKGNYSDVVLQSKDEDRQFFVHRAVLMARSSYFCALFSGNFIDSNAPLLKMDLLDGSSLEQIIKYVYGVPVMLQGDATIATLNERLMELTSVASMLLMNNLEKKCVHQLVKRISPKDLKLMMKFAKVTQSNVLREACVTEVNQLFSREELLEFVADNL